MLGEATNTRVREKTSLLACSISILTTFATSFTMPYLINQGYAGLGGKVGFVYGSLCFAMNVVAYLVVPEMKGRSLEEIDALFERGVPLRQFRRAYVGDVVAVPVLSVDSGGVSESDERSRATRDEKELPLV